MSTKGDRLRKLSGGLILLLIGTIVGVTLVSELRLLPVGHAVSEPAKEKLPAILPSDQVFVKISKAVTPAVVNISTTRIIRNNAGGQGGFPFNDPFFRRFFGEVEPPGHRRSAPQQRKEQSLGSGVIVSSDGLIITNNHVIEEADEIKVLMEDKREFKGTVVGKDKKSDIAVLRIEADNLPTVPWSNSDNLQVGEYVVAVGNPFGLNQTVTMGIVSAIGRANVGIADYEDFIQTDAAINPGNSGGALVNIRGELVGVNTAIFTRSGGYMGVGFAVPSNMVRSVMDSLVKTGKVTRGWLGVSIQDITPALAKEFGLKDAKGSLVTDVMPDSPAAKAALKRGDVIFSFTGQDIENSSHLRNRVARTAVGTKASVKIIRDKKEKEIFVTLSEQPKEVAQKGEQNGEEDEKESESSYGISVSEVTPEIAEQFDLDPREKGVLIVQVAGGSIADEAGFREGDLIIEINRKTVSDLKSYERLFAKIKKGESVLFLINRQGSRFFLTLTPEKG